MAILAIAELEKDIDAIRRYTKKFAFARYGLSKEYYRRWKTTYQKEAWEKVVESHIQQIIDNTTKEWKVRKSWRPPHPPLLSALADIYIEEGLFGSLV